MGLFYWVHVDADVELPDWPEGEPRDGFQGESEIPKCDWRTYYPVTIDIAGGRLRVSSCPFANIERGDLNYHVALHFYTYVNTGELKPEWFEYVAKFEAGNLICIKRLRGEGA